MHNPVTVRITVEQMRDTIIHAFSTRDAEIKQGIANGIDAALEQFNFPKECEKIVIEVLHDVVSDALRTLKWNTAFREAMVKSLVKSLR